MRPLIVVFVLILLLACAAEPTGPVRIPAGEFAGTWSLTLTDTADCAGSASFVDSITLHVTLDPLEPGISLVLLDASTSRWSAGTTSGWMSGFVGPFVASSALFNLYGGSFQSGGADPDSTAQFAGTIDADLTIRGWLVEPGPSGHSTLFGTQPCTYRAIARHS